MKKSKILVILTGALISVPAFAGDFMDMNTSDIYVAADLGLGTYSNTGFATNAQSGVSSPSGTTEAIGVGYDFNRYFAVEAGYTNFASQTVISYGANDSGSISGDATTLMAVGSYPFGNGFSGFIKAGYAYDQISAGQTWSSNDFAYGLGIKYDITKNWSARLQYQDFGKTQVGIGNTDLSETSIGLMYRF